MQKSWVIGFVTICDKFKNKLLHTSTVSPPPPPPPQKKIWGWFGGFEIWTKRRARKNCSEIGGLVERGGVHLERGDFQIVSSVFLQKGMFSLLLDFFVW